MRTLSILRGLAPSLAVLAITAAAASALAQGAPQQSQSHLPERTPEQKAKDQALIDYARKLGITLDEPQKPGIVAQPEKPIATAPEPAPASSSSAASNHDRDCLALFEKYSVEQDGILNRINGANQDSIAAGASTYCGAAQAGYREMVRLSCPAALVAGAKQQWDMAAEMLAKHNGRNASNYKCSR
jgi:hypothetical protein